MEPNQHILYQTLEQLQILKAELKTESEQKENFLLRAEAENSWFTQPEIVRMIDTICEKYLDQQKLLLREIFLLSVFMICFAPGSVHTKQS